MTKTQTGRVLIAGAGTYGFWNTGDEAILQSMVSELRTALPAVEVTVVSANPSGSLAGYAVAEVPSGNLQALIRAAAESHVMVLGGGGIFHDYWGFAPDRIFASDSGGMELWFKFAFIAAILDKPLVVYGVGVGPIIYPEARAFLRLVTNSARLVTVRDHASRDVLEAAGVDIERVRVTADPAFTLLPVAGSRVKQLVKDLSEEPWERPIIGVALREWELEGSRAWEGEVAAGLDRYIARQGGTLLFIPFHKSAPGADDTAVAKRVDGAINSPCRRLTASADLLPQEKLALIGRCDVLLGMRLHSLIFAASAGVPLAALEYDPKVTGLLEELECPERGLALADLTAEAVEALVRTAAPPARSAVRRLAERAQFNALLLRDALREAMAPSVPAPMMVSERVKELEARLVELETELKSPPPDPEINVQLQSLQSELRSLDAQRVARESELGGLRQALEAMRVEVRAVYGSRGYRALRLFRLARSELLGGPSRALDFLRRAWHYIRSRRNEFGASLDADQDPLLRALDAGQGVLAGPPRSAASELPAAPAKPEVREGARTRSGTGPPRVAYFTNQLLDWHDQRPRYGGGERYCMALAALLRDLGFEVDLYQIAPVAFDGEYRGWRVRALAHGEFFSEFNLGAASEFYEISLGYDHVLYNMPELSAGRMRLDAVSVCHGIWFDHNNYRTMGYREPAWYSFLQRAFSNPRSIVSVDTNSINVIRSLWPELATRMRFIPNFVDLSLFTPAQRDESGRRLRVLLPRRSQVNRGSRILGDILDKIPHDVEITWLGEGDDPDTRILLDLCRRDPRLRFETATFDEMPDWYRRSDICVIPTIACEGTSLSCIEALASGCATVATQVGGLTDLVQDGVNGLLVAPRSDDIARAINRLIEDASERHRLQEAGPISATRFALSSWRGKWGAALEEWGWLESPVPHRDKRPEPRTVILTRNAFHGGVESLVRIESHALRAPVIVCGGLDDPFGTCPFAYSYVSTYEELRSRLREFDLVLYHWPPAWAVQAIRDSGLPAAEIVHRVDTSDCDKTVPASVGAVAVEVLDHLRPRVPDAVLVSNAIDTERFRPTSQPSEGWVGAIVGYHQTKGLDVFLRAWAKVRPEHRTRPVRFHGAGEAQAELMQLARELGVTAQFLGPVSNPHELLPNYRLVVSPSRVEGLPLMVLEAMACNVAVVASGIPAHAYINRLAGEVGLPPPLRLFRPEDIDDMAAQMDAALDAVERPASRDVVLRLFSAERHVEGVRDLLRQAWSKGSPNPELHLRLIEEREDTGTIAEDPTHPGFLCYQARPDGGADILNASIARNGAAFATTHDRFLAYQQVVPEGCRKISTIVYARPSEPADVWLQYDWLDASDMVLKTTGEGHAITTAAPGLYAMQDVPDKNIARLRIVIRPGAGQTVPIRSVFVRAWAGDSN